MRRKDRCSKIIASIENLSSKFIILLKQYIVDMGVAINAEKNGFWGIFIRVSWKLRFLIEKWNQNIEHFKFGVKN